MNISKKRVLVTGLHGFIGGYLKNTLEPQYTCIGYNGNMLTEDWDEYINNTRPDYLINLAWITGLGYSSSELNLEFYRKSIELYEAFYKYGGINAVFIGTEQEYKRSSFALTEESELEPKTLYSYCKCGLGKILVEKSKQCGNNFCWCRVFFVYGSGEKQARLMPSLINGLLKNEIVTCSYDGFVRDYLHVSDVASALCFCLENNGVNIVNIGSGSKTTIGMIADEVIKQVRGTGSVKFKTLDECFDQPMVVYADNSKLKQLGWSQKVSLSNGIAMEIEFFKKGMYWK